MIHRDLLLGPQNDPYETTLLHEDWARELRKLFTYCTPIFLGYGGNDGSLMNFLEALHPGSIPGGIFWCYLDGGELPNKRICRLIRRHSGKLVTILNFDVFMTQLAEPLEFGLLDYQISEGAERRAKRLREEWEEVKRSVEDRVEPGEEGGNREEASRVARGQLGRVETRRAREANDRWSWELRANAEADPVKREAIYREALEQVPNSPELIGSFASFLNRTLGKTDEAVELYNQALELDPSNDINVGNFANLLYEIRGEYDKAEQLYRRSLELKPHNLRYNANLTEFLLSQGRFEEAKDMSDRAWSLVKGRPLPDAVSIPLLRGLLLLTASADDGPALGRLKKLLNDGHHSENWHFEKLLASVRVSLKEDDRQLYAALANAIRDPEKVSALEEFPRWREVTPIPIDEPWPPLGRNSSP